MTLAEAFSELTFLVFSISTVNSEFGAEIVTNSGVFPSMVNKAATLAAVETLPVVIPDFSFEFT